MKRIALFILIGAVQSVAADDAPPALETSQYRVPFAFIEWVENEGKPPPRYPPGMCVCNKLSLGASPWPAGASGVYLASGSRLIVRHTPLFLKAVAQLILQWQREGGRRPPDPRLLKILRDQCPSPTSP